MSPWGRATWLRYLGALCVFAACSNGSEHSAAPSAGGGASGAGGVAGTTGSAGEGAGEDGGTAGGGDDAGGDHTGGRDSRGDGSGGVSAGSGTGGEAGSEVPPVGVTTASLPDATLNQDYRVVFEARGGNEARYVWTLDGGRLPRGVALERDGTLSGIPLEGGHFELEVSVTDSDGSTARATFELVVKQSRWLVYESTLNGNTWIPRVEAVDLASRPYQRTLISTGVPANHNGLDASLRSFSPDGRFFVYSLFVYADHVSSEVRLVDFDGDSPRELVVNDLEGDDGELVKVYGAEWSPDSKQLAFTALVEDNTGDLRVPGRFGFFDVDAVLASPNVSTNLKRRPEGVATDFVDWATPATVVYKRQAVDENSYILAGPMVKATWQGNGFGEPVPLLNSVGEPYGESFYVYYVNRATQSAVIARSGQPHCLASLDVYRFDRDEAVSMGTAPLLPAPDLTRFAGVSDSTLKIVDLANAPLAELGPSDCHLVEWSADGTLLGWVDTAAKQYQIARVDSGGQATTAPVPGGTYDAHAERPRFSPDRRWMAYRADGSLFMTRLDGTEIRPATRVSVELFAPQTDQVGSYRFAPNGRGLVYLAAGRIAGLDELYFVDLSGAVPGPSLPISPDLSTFPSDDRIQAPSPEADYEEYWERRIPLWNPWTPDSSKVFFVVHDTSAQSGDVLYIVDLLDQDPRPEPVDSAPCDSSACGSISPPSVQTPRRN